jgi:predicted ATPase
MSDQFIRHVSLELQEIDTIDNYPFNLPAIRSLKQLSLNSSVTFFVGENGSGKSTLLEAIAVSIGFNAEGGTKNFRFNTRVSHSDLHRHLRVAKSFRKPVDGFFFRAESYFNVATEIEKLDADPSFSPPIADSYGDRPLHEQSHGESFMALLMNRFSGKSIFILDEPEASLSPQRQLAALSRIHDLVLDDCQFIIATHSPILMAYPNAHILQFSKDGISFVDYHDTDNYTITKGFLADPQRTLNVLLER